MRYATCMATTLAIFVASCDEDVVARPETLLDIPLETTSFLLRDATKADLLRIDDEYAARVQEAQKRNDDSLDSVKKDIRRIVRRRLLTAAGDSIAVTCQVKRKERGGIYYFKKDSMGLRTTGAASGDVPIEIAGVTGAVKYAVELAGSPRFTQTEAENAVGPFNVEGFTFWATYDVQIDGTSTIGWSFSGHYYIDADDPWGKAK